MTLPTPAEPRADVGMAWGIKRSFMDYLLRVGDARWEFTGGASFTTAHELYFPLADEQPDWPVVALAGTATVTAHFGALRLVIDRPVVRIGPNGSLSAGPVRLADLAPAPVIPGDVLMWRFTDVRLAPDAVPLLDGAYAAGEAFDPVTLRVPPALVGRHLEEIAPPQQT